MLRGTSHLLRTQRRLVSTLTAPMPTGPVIHPRAPARSPAQVSVLANGITVITEDDQGPVSTAHMFVRAGTRYETEHTVGCSQHAHAMAFNQDTNNRSSLWIKRESEHLGLSLSSSYGREYVSYHAQALRSDINRALDNLADAVTGPIFYPWEVTEASELVRLHQQKACGHTRIMDAVHKAAFRHGLGNYCMCPAHRLGSVTSEAMTSYFSSLYTGDRMVIVGSGVDHEEFVHVIKKNFSGVPATSSATSSPSKYFGGEARVDAAGSFTKVVVAHQGAARQNAAVQQVLSALVSSPSAVKYGKSTSPLAALTGAYAKSVDVSYSDAGLFGVYVNAPADKAGAAVKEALAAVGKVLNGGFQASDVQRAKNLVANHMFELSRAERAEFLATHSAQGKAVTPEDYAQSVEQVSEAAVKSFAKGLTASKKTVVAYGNLWNCPYADELN